MAFLEFFPTAVGRAAVDAYGGGGKVLIFVFFDFQTTPKVV